MRRAASLLSHYGPRARKRAELATNYVLSNLFFLCEAADTIQKWDTLTLQLPTECFPSQARGTE
jgi:hypothetical protein